MVLVGVGEVGATYDDVLHDGCDAQTEGGLGACMAVGMVEGELVPRKSFESAGHYKCDKVVGKGEEVVDMEEGMGEGTVEGTVGVGVGCSM